MLIWQSLTCSPTSDERDHLAAGIATARLGDLGFYRVNPPLHKLVSGVPVNSVYSPDMGYIPYVSMLEMPRVLGTRLGQRLITQNPETYPRFFIVGRLVRIPIILLAGFMLAWGLPLALRPAGALAAILWFTSPLVLGNGWLIMPDALSGATAAILLVASLRWLALPDFGNVILCGFAWGLSLSTKFTFCPILLLWPSAIVAYRVFFWSGWRREWKLFGGGLLVQCVIAWFVVVTAYGANQVGVPVGKHQFKSERLEWLNEPVAKASSASADSASGNAAVALFRMVPSPFPKQFMKGIDDQQIDLERGYPTYLMGTWYRDGAWWWIFPAYLLKEQTVAWVLLGLVPVGVWLSRRRARSRPQGETEVDQEARIDNAALSFCLVAAGMVFLILALNGKMALNVRYLFPALPALYLALGITWRKCFQESRYARWASVGWMVVVTAELLMVTPHWFAYINPIAGGMYRVPAALHASNFDGGQDLWRLEQWVAEQSTEDRERLWICLHSDVLEPAIKFDVRVPTESMLRELIESKTSGREMESEWTVVVMRGLGAPAPWNRVIGQTSYAEFNPLIERLVRIEPDEFLTPTLAVYRTKSLDE